MCVCVCVCVWRGGVVVIRCKDNRERNKIHHFNSFNMYAYNVSVAYSTAWLSLYPCC